MTGPTQVSGSRRQLPRFAGLFRRARWRGHALPVVALGLLSLEAVACGGGAKETSPVAAPKSQAHRSSTIEHEKCDVTGSHTETLDTNGDGKPDLRRVYDGAKHEVCRAVDLNNDGRSDLFEYFDASGAIRRREFAYGDTGEVNAVETYQAGKLVEREYDTTGQHKIDTWDWFDPNAPIDGKTGRPAHPSRRERDLHGDGTINQWWTWNGDKVSIATDHNGDGKPDPDSVIVLGGGDEGGAPAPAAASPTAAPAMSPGDDAGSDGGNS